MTNESITRYRKALADEFKLTLNKSEVPGKYKMYGLPHWAADLYNDLAEMQHGS